MSIASNLYPPIVSTYMPAFIRTEKCKIYFWLSSMNLISDIKNVQMVVRYQNNNLSALDENIYYSEIKICQLEVENERENKYSVTLEPNDLETKIFETNQFYQIQLRFTDKNAAAVPQNGRIENWLIENNKYFSEWSRICLIRGINRPELVVNDFKFNIDNTYKSNILSIAAQLKYEDTSENEKIKSYNLKLYSKNDNILIEDSKIQYCVDTFDFNQINYSFKSELINEKEYILKISYTTYNNYSEEAEYSIIADITIAELPFDFLLTGESNEELGINTLTFDIQNIDNSFSGKFLIKRSSSENNFKYWEDLYELFIPKYNMQKIEYLWNDLTPKIGIWYKYAVQYIDGQNNKSQMIKEKDDTAFVLFSEDSFLVDTGKLLTLRYDTQISSIKHNNMDSIVNTLGSKYPIIRRNGNTDYRQFPLSGTITLLSDDGELFEKKDKILKNDFQNSSYQDYIEENNITLPMNDIILEREFREQVERFLRNGKVKLFRSITEGNILVKLTDISVTPLNGLGRRIYSFSSTATEIGEDNIDNYVKYNILGKQNINLKPIYEIYLRVKKYDRDTDTVFVRPSQVVNAEEALILNRRIVGYEEVEGDEVEW